MGTICNFQHMERAHIVTFFCLKLGYHNILESCIIIPILFTVLGIKIFRHHVEFEVIGFPIVYTVSMVICGRKRTKSSYFKNPK